MRRGDRPLVDQLKSPWPWHRWLGVGAALLLVWAALTGMVLVHSEDLGLRQRPVTAGLVLDLFGVPEPALELGYRSPQGWVAADDGAIYLGPSRLPAQLGELEAVLVGHDATVIAGSDGLLLLGADGSLLELLPPGSDPQLEGLITAPAEPLPDEARQQIARAARSAALDWEQVVRVLHGNRAGGWFGKLLADLIALSLIALSVTGVVMFVQRRREQRARR